MNRASRRNMLKKSLLHKKYPGMPLSELAEVLSKTQQKQRVLVTNSENKAILEEKCNESE